MLTLKTQHRLRAQAMLYRQRCCAGRLIVANQMTDVQHVSLGINGKPPKGLHLGTVRDLNNDPAESCRIARHEA